MEITKSIDIKKDVVVSVLCDICKSIIPDDELGERFIQSHVGGYYSVFGDGTEFKFDICQHCMKDIMEEYNIIPECFMENGW